SYSSSVVSTFKLPIRTLLLLTNFCSILTLQDDRKNNMRKDIHCITASRMKFTRSTEGSKQAGDLCYHMSELQTLCGHPACGPGLASTDVPSARAVCTQLASHQHGAPPTMPKPQITTAPTHTRPSRITTDNQKNPLLMSQSQQLQYFSEMSQLEAAYMEAEEDDKVDKWQDKISSGFDRLMSFASTELDKRRRSTEGASPRGGDSATSCNTSPDSGIGHGDPPPPPPPVPAPKKRCPSDVGGKPPLMEETAGPPRTPSPSSSIDEHPPPSPLPIFQQMNPKNTNTISKRNSSIEKIGLVGERPEQNFAQRERIGNGTINLISQKKTERKSKRNYLSRDLYTFMSDRKGSDHSRRARCNQLNFVRRYS
ncbi:hypothetical protein L9F63_017535, partial [Diploptera punctata]